MKPEDIFNTYFKPNTKGYKILYLYFSKYRDLFERTIHFEFNEFLNQIFLNVSGIKFSEDIKNAEAYIIGTIKIQCRVQLDKALKIKRRKQSEIENIENDEDEEKYLFENIPTKEPDPHNNVEADEIFNIVNFFKLSLNIRERDIFNSLIDGISRKEIADKKKQNLNTIDTQIRRVRIKFSAFLKENGYTFNISDKYDLN